MRAASAGALSLQEQSNVTTLMIRGLPHKAEVRDALAELVYFGARDAIDFIHVPFTPGFSANMGFALVNFTTVEAASRLWRAMDGSFWNFQKSRKTIRVVSAHVQGFEEAILHSFNMLDENTPSKHLPLVFEDGQVVPFSVALQKVVQQQHNLKQEEQEWRRRERRKIRKQLLEQMTQMQQVVASLKTIACAHVPQTSEVQGARGKVEPALCEAAPQDITDLQQQQQQLRQQQQHHHHRLLQQQLQQQTSSDRERHEPRQTEEGFRSSAPRDEQTRQREDVQQQASVPSADDTGADADVDADAALGVDARQREQPRRHHQQQLQQPQQHQPEQRHQQQQQQQHQHQHQLSEHSITSRTISETLVLVDNDNDNEFQDEFLEQAMRSDSRPRPRSAATGFTAVTTADMLDDDREDPFLPAEEEDLGTCASSSWKSSPFDQEEVQNQDQRLEDPEGGSPFLQSYLTSIPRVPCPSTNQNFQFGPGARAEIVGIDLNFPLLSQQVGPERPLSCPQGPLFSDSLLQQRQQQQQQLPYTQKPSTQGPYEGSFSSFHSNAAYAHHRGLEEAYQSARVEVEDLLCNLLGQHARFQEPVPASST